MKHWRSFALASGMALLLTGCGYHIGFTGHPQLETVAVAPAVNDTAFYHVAADMRMTACEAFMQDGSLKLVDQSTADCVLYCTVKEVSFAEMSGDNFDDRLRYQTAEWVARVAVDYNYIIPGQAQPLKKGSVTGQARFHAPFDVEVSRQRAVRQACYEAAKKVVWALTEGW